MHCAAFRRIHVSAIEYISAESLANKLSDGRDSPELREKDRALRGYSVRTGLGFKSRLDRQAYMDPARVKG